MKRLWLVGGLMATAAACGVATEPETAPGATTVAPAPSTTQPAAATTTKPPAVVPTDPVPARDGACPYLKTMFVADTNGQRVARVRLSADQPHPACFFYRSDGAEQLRVQVLAGTEPAAAKALVDRVAPVATSDPATVPGGWEGGKQPTDSGAVFAVAKAGTAVVVITNQQQTIKASRIAEQVITTLGL